MKKNRQTRKLTEDQQELRRRERVIDRAWAEALDTAIDQQMFNQDLADVMGIDVATVSRYRSGTIPRSLGRTAIIAEILGISLTDIFGSAGAPDSSTAPARSRAAEDIAREDHGERPRSSRTSAPQGHRDRGRKHTP